MNTEIYRMIYCSRNRIKGKDLEVSAEIQQILRTSRANNAEAGVTGALLYNAGNFAQTLEGPPGAVEEIFERIQQDFRHSDVTIIESGPATSRIFGNWAMAMCGNASATPVPATTAVFEAAFARSSGASGKILSLLNELVLQDDEAILLDAW